MNKIHIIVVGVALLLFQGCTTAQWNTVRYGNPRGQQVGLICLGCDKALGIYPDQFHHQEIQLVV